jgi:hypothetical protein
MDELAFPPCKPGGQHADSKPALSCTMQRTQELNRSKRPCKMPEELTGAGAPTQARQGTSKKNSEEEGETNLLLPVPTRLLVKYKHHPALPGFAAPSASGALLASGRWQCCAWDYGLRRLASTGDNRHLGGGLACTTPGRRGAGVGLAERAAGAALSRPLAHLTVPSSALVAATSSNI